MNLIERISRRGAAATRSRLAPSCMPSGRASRRWISRTKLTGLVEHYGFTEGDAGTEYFVLHAERDHEHAELSRQVLADAPSNLAAVAESALQGNWRLLDGCCR